MVLIVSSSLQRSGFPFLVGIAFGIALLGLAGNIMHLSSLMRSQMKLEHLTHFSMVRDDATANAKTNSNLGTQQQSEHAVFQRMLRYSIASLEHCHERESQVPPLNINNNWMANRTNKLSRFGFMNALTNYLSDNKAKQRCKYPPLTSCQVTSYSIITTTTTATTTTTTTLGLQLRSLFLNCMSWITNDNVATIYVILPNSAKSELEHDTNYGQRLLSWDADKAHQVKLVWVHSIWDALGNITQSTTTDALLLMDADSVWNGNVRGLDAGFDLWKKHSNNIVASGGWPINLQPAPTKRAIVTTDSAGYMNHTTSNENNELSPVCKDQQVTSSIENVQLVALSGAFVHRSLLCFVSHSVFKPIRQFATNAQEERVALSILMTQLSGHSLRLFPSTVRGPGEVKRSTSASEQTSQENAIRPEAIQDGVKSSSSSRASFESANTTDSVRKLSKTLTTITPATVKVKTAKPLLEKSSTMVTKGTASTKLEKSKRMLSKQRNRSSKLETPINTTTISKEQKSTHAVVEKEERRKRRLGHRRMSKSKKNTKRTNEKHVSRTSIISKKNLIVISSKHRRRRRRRRRRRLLQEHISIQTLDDDFVSAIIGYFGSMPVESISWCSLGCSIFEDALPSDITWMNEACEVL